MIQYVIDACTAVKLYLHEPLMVEAANLFQLLATDPPTAEFHVPDLFYAESGNIFWKHVRRGTISAHDASEYCDSLRLFPLIPSTAYDLITSGLSIALTHGTSVYDACYVALADRLGVPLITADRKLEYRLTGTPYMVIWLGNWSPPP